MQWMQGSCARCLSHDVSCLGTVCNMCFEIILGQTFNWAWIHLIYKLIINVLWPIISRSQGLTCGSNWKTMLMFLHETHHILMSSLARGKSIWSPWGLLPSWCKPSWIFLIILLVIGPFIGLEPWGEFESCNGFRVDPSINLSFQ